MNRLFIEFLITSKRFILLAVIEIFLFLSYFYIVSPSNFGSFSDSLRYYISALGTLLAVVVSFNTLALQNQLKNLPRNLAKVEKQIEKINNLLEPVIQKSQYPEISNNNNTSKNNSEKKTFECATENLSDAVKAMILIVKDISESIVNNKKKIKNNLEEKEEETDITTTIASRLLHECVTYLSLFEKTKQIFSLIIMSTTESIQKLRFKTDKIQGENERTLYEVLKRLHVIKSIGISIFIRNTLADLSKELLIATIPVITFIGLISSISNYENYNILMIRILFAVSISITSVPFILLFMRTIPILYLIKKTSTIPFSRQ